MADQDTKDLPKPFVQLRGFDAAHYQRTERYAKQVEKLFATATQEICNLASTAAQTIASDPDKPFSFDAFPRTKRQAQGFVTRLVGKMTATIDNATRQEWLAACSKNDAFVESILRTTRLSRDELEQYHDRNIEALNSFQKRKSEGMSLSDRVWRIAGNFKTEMETAIDVAIGDGRPAAELSRDVKGLLNHPDKLFRRVRDKATGELRLSRAAAAFHPGRGVYRSSHLNAMRLARTEVNMAYRQAEYLRWQQLDFVVGIRISLSNNHTRLNSKGKPEAFEDICDLLAGDYPKTFKFVGWHPQCRCLVTPIMKTYKEYNDERAGRLKAIVRGEAYKSLPSRRTVPDVPPQFRAYIDSISQRAKGWKSQPYYIRDNFKGGTIVGGLNPIIPQRAGQISGTTKAPAPQPCTKYDAQISELKQYAYTFGLDCSRLDALRTAGNESQLYQEIERLTALKAERYGQWQEAEREFADFCGTLPLSDITLLKTFLTKFGDSYKKNQYADGRYYADCISNLKATVAAAKMWYAQRQAAEAAAEAQAKAEGKLFFTKAQTNNQIKISKDWGIQQGEQMTHEQADDGKVNPNYSKGGGYHVNCQTCTVTYMLRRMGFDVEAVSNAKDFVWKELKAQGISWQERFLQQNGTKIPRLISAIWGASKGYKLMTKPRIAEFCASQLTTDGVYEVYVAWKSGSAHVFLALVKDGKVSYYDPQDNLTGVESYFDEAKGRAISITRIDDKIINPKLKNLFIPKKP